MTGVMTFRYCVIGSQKQKKNPDTVCCSHRDVASKTVRKFFFVSRDIMQKVQNGVRLSGVYD
ncbi:hypothetical protein Pcaca03_18940 [Pectobacterium carotovorum subsp. carotovorum]|uniref:Uncharacterized protein n=1 Tax=Pectobacterium carotovorum subsp. carotovorum TaxID=555 RepID=A0AAI9L143_PECCC|nr:hypothetical protein Pcaca03_18940 [Pectobacterium carotovorum subsp. carotovorum]